MFLKTLKGLLLRIVDDIDSGNTNISEEEAIQIASIISNLSYKRFSKYSACRYLNISRATFDNYVREGKIPKGKHDIGFKELSWSKKDLDEFIKNNK